MKKIALIIAGVLVTLIIAALVAPSFVDWNPYKPQIQEQAESATGLRLNLAGDVGLSLLPAPYLYIENVQLQNPDQPDDNYIARLERLDVSLQLMPLFGGEIVFDSVRLVRPDIVLQVDEAGRQNWMTPEVEAMTGQQSSATEPEQGVEASNTPRQTPAQISIDSISIENGRFSYLAQGAREPVVLSEITGTLRAETMQGPFSADGAFEWAGRTMKIQARTERLSQQSGTVPVKVEMSVAPEGASLSFGGVVATRDSADLQGRLTLSLASLSSAFPGNPPPLGGSDDSLDFQGVITASQNAVLVKDATLKFAGADMTGAASVNLQTAPMQLSLQLAGRDIVNLDALLSAAPQGASAPPVASSAAPGSPAAQHAPAFIPATLSLPRDFAADVSVNLLGVVYKEEVYNDVTAEFQKQDSRFTVTVNAQDIPGSGQLSATGNFAYAARSQSQPDGAVIFSEPSFNVSLNGRTQNLPQTLEALTGAPVTVLPPQWKAVSIDTRVALAGDGSIRLDKTALDLGGSRAEISGSYRPAAQGVRPLVSVTAGIDRINLDEFSETSGAESKSSTAGSNKTPAASRSADPVEAVKNISLPVDLAFDITVEALQAAGHDLRGVRGQGSLKGSSVILQNLSAQDIHGASAKLTGSVGNLNALSDIDLSLTGQSSDIRRFAQAFGMDVSSLPQSVNQADLSAKATGNSAALDASANVTAMNGELTASGKVEEPFSAPAFNNMQVRVQHANTNQGLAILSPAAPQFASWNKPMDISAVVERAQDALRLNDIKGTLAGTPLNGRLEILTADKLTVNGDFQFGDLSMITSAAAATVKPSSAGSSGSSPPRQAGQSRWSTEPMDNGWLHAFNARLNITGDRLVYDRWDLSNPVLKLDLKDGSLTFSEVGAGMYGGQLGAAGTVGASQQAGPLSVDIQVKAQNVALEQFVSAFTGSRLLQASGSVSLDTSFKGAGASQSALIGSLSGQGTATGQSLVLEGFDLTRLAGALSQELKPADTLQGLWRTTIEGGSTRFDTLDGAFSMQQGVVTISKLDLDGPEALLDTRGTVSLPAWWLDTAHTVTLKNNTEVPPFTIELAGPLDNPARTFGQGAIQDYLQRKIERKVNKELQNLIGERLGLPAAPQTEPSGGNGGEPGGQQQQQPSPEDAIKGVLEGLLSR